MATALLDTNAVSDLMRGDAQVKARIAKHAGTIATSVITVGEIEYGLNRLPAGKKRRDLESSAKSVLVALQIEGVTEAIAVVYGQLKASLEASGLNLDDNDLWIVATALANGSQLVSRDQVFAQVPGLLIVDWSV